VSCGVADCVNDFSDDHLIALSFVAGSRTENHGEVQRLIRLVDGFWRRRSVAEVEKTTMAQQNGCSMDLAVDEDGLEGAVDGVVVDGAAAVNGHTSGTTEVVGAAAAGPSSSSVPAISRVDRDVIRLIAQHLQNLGLKYDNFLIWP